MLLAATAAIAGAVGGRALLVTEPAPSRPTSREIDVPAEDYRARADDPRQLVLGLTIGLGDEVVGASASETATTVTVRVRVRQDLRVKAALGIAATAVVTLNDPLGPRAVVDVSGRRLVERR